MNPNLPSGLSENTDRARGQRLDETPILPEAGNVWPGPPQPLPTLTDVSREQGNDLSGTMPNGSGGPVSGGHASSAMRDGGGMSMGESDSVAHGADTGDTDSFSGGGVLSGQVPDASSQYRSKPPAGKGGGDIVIPNGDGTSTVIGPDGTVKTLKGPGPKQP